MLNSWAASHDSRSPVHVPVAAALRPGNVYGGSRARSGRIATLTVSLILSLLFSAATQRGSAQTGSESHRYRLQGMVINSLTSQPISHALVEVVDPAYQATLTDVEGRFGFEDLPKGSVRLVAQKPGFVGAGSYKAVSRTEVVVEIESHETDTTLRLAPESVISGRLTDQNRVPIEGAVVSLVRADIIEGRRQWQQLPMQVTSDSDGNFRFAELGPASYCIVVNTRNVPIPREAVERYVDVSYYPGNPVSSSSDVTLDLAAGQQAQIDLSLSRMPVYQVSGTVIGTNFARQLGVHVLDAAGNVLSFPVHFDAKGGFRIERIPAGRYFIRNETQEVSGRIFFSKQDINVDSDIANLRIPLLSPVSIPIYVRSEFGANTPTVGSLESNVKVVLHPTKPFQADVHSILESSRESRLIVPDVDAGEYSVSVRSSLGYVSSLRCGGVDLFREKLIVQSGVPITPIEVVLRDDTAAVSGSVRSDKPMGQATVLLAPEFAPSQPPRVVEADSLGRFSQQGLAPGVYRVFAFDSVKDLEYANPKVLSRYASQGERIALSANANQDLILNLIVTEEE